MSQIYDCFTLYDELDLLEIRLNVLDKVVDKFVIVEGERTFQNKEKPLYLLNNLARFEKFRNKIIHVIVPAREFVEDPWSNERKTFSYIANGLTSAGGDDIVVVSCIDEIPKPEVIASLKYQISEPVHLEMKLFYFYLNTCFKANVYGHDNWHGSFVGKRSMLNAYGDVYDTVIGQRRKLKHVPNAGWHFSYLGSEKQIVSKLNSFSHTNFNHLTTEDIATNKKNLSDPLGRGDIIELDHIMPISELPEYIQKNAVLYDSLIYKNILLIGGNGYIGSRVYEYLKAKNYNVTNVDSCEFGQIYPETVKTKYQNLTEGFLLPFTHIVLLAGCSSVGTSKDIHYAFANNVTHFNDLVKKINHSQTLIYASSCSVYGASEQTSTEEDKLTPPLSNYDFTKQCIDYINNFSDKNCVGLRFGTVGGYSPNLLEELIANAMTVNSNKNKEILVSNGGANRSILGLSDLCRAIETLILAAKIPKKIYNLCSFSNTVLEIGQKVQQISGANLIQNQSLHTNYSFTVSNERFQKDFNFVFADSMESIYNELIENKDRIVLSSNRYGPAK